MRRFLGFYVVLGAVALAIGLQALPYRNGFDGFVEDAVIGLRGAILPDSGYDQAAAVVVALDDSSVAAPELAGLPRALMSPVWTSLAQKALDHGATVVGFDFIFAFDAGQLSLNGERPLAEYETPFLDLLAREGPAGRVVIGRSAALPPARRFGLMATGAGTAFIDIVADADGVVRKMPTAFPRDDGATAVTMVGALLGRSDLGDIALTPPGPIPELPSVRAIDVMRCDDERALSRLFENRIVVIGSTLSGEDRHVAADRFLPRHAPAPVAAQPCALERPTLGDDRQTPGAFLHAAAIDAARSGWMATLPKPLAVSAAMALVAAVASLIAFASRPPIAAIALFALAALAFAGPVAALELGLLAPAGRLLAALMAGAGIGFAGRHLATGRRVRALLRGFNRFLAPSLVRDIAEGGRAAERTWRKRRIAVLFADLSGFTSYAEHAPLEAMAEDVNSYLEVIARLVSAHGGYVDKFIGDGVMALWNAPTDHPEPERAALSAAIAINEALNRSPPSGRRPFAVTIAVHSGDAIVGNMGDVDRLNYTAIGDCVNVAARMEAWTSRLGAEILVGEGCAAAAPSDVPMLEAAKAALSGRDEPVRLFAPLSARDAAFAPAYAASLAAFKAGRLNEAEQGFGELGAADWSAAPVARAMADIAKRMAPSLDANGWSGVIGPDWRSKNPPPNLAAKI